MDFASGTQVSSVVRLVRPLGHGGMGAVWVAEHLTLQTEVVVKFMSEALSADPVSLARFSREASAAAAVKSPHVVQMLDYGFMTDGTPFIVMERLEGEDLKQRLARDHALPLEQLVAIITQACKALGRAHASGIVHRDIKPDNIFLCRTDDDEPFVKLLDFGIAKSGGPNEFHMTQTGVMVGTPFYMSPEQALGSPPVDSTTDLWSLGIVAYEAMTGARPFDGPTLGALTLAICNEGPPVPSQVGVGIPPEVDAWVARACARERTERFATAKAMSEALVAAIRKAEGAHGAALAFQATALSKGSSGPPKGSSQALPAMPKIPVLPPIHGLATTTTPLVSLANPSNAPATPFAPVLAPMPAPSPSRRAPYLAVGAMLLVFGVAAGFVVAQRDDGDAPAAPPPVAAVAAPGPEPKPAEPHVAAPPAAESASPPPAASATPRTTPPLASQPLPPAATKPTAPSGPTSRPPPHAATSATVPTAAATAPVSCDPPYYFDAAHNKVFKKECL